MTVGACRVRVGRRALPRDGIAFAGKIWEGAMRPYLSGYRGIYLASVAGAGLVIGSPAMARDASSPQPASAVLPGADATTDEADYPEEPIVVSGSRIEKAGFEQPTPTTVLGGTELSQASRVSLQQALNDQPQIRNTVAPASTIGSTGSGTAPVDLRGLGRARTLTLVNGRRFIGDNNLNFVPTNMVKRVELVTGGASAAWGSDAVAGVVNIILDDKFEGAKIGAHLGVSGRGDGMRHGVDGTFGTEFSGGRGHFIIGAEYVRDKGIGTAGRRDRPWLGAGLVALGDGRLEVRPDVNSDLFPLSQGGTILSGSLAGQAFNPDGTLAPYTLDRATSVTDNQIVASPVERIGAYARATFDVADGVNLWLDGAFGQVKVDQPFFADTAQPLLVFPVMANNPFLSAGIRSHLAMTGEPFFILGRYSTDAFVLQYDSRQQSKEIALGMEADLGGGWKFDAHFSHGETDSKARIGGAAVTSKFFNALNSVSSAGEIVCAINADADPSNDDPACAPFNPFGQGSPSAESIAYITGVQRSDTVSKLDSVAARVQGDPFSLWAGPVSVALGVEGRWQEQDQEIGTLDAAGAFATTVYPSALDGGFNVKEAFGELLLPLFKADNLEIDVNGAARYSDYSISGGIWSWKAGATVRLFDGLLLRATHSRDIRAPSIANLFSPNLITIRTVADADSEGRNHPDYNPNPRATVFTGGNADLVPEVSKTWTVGGSISPAFLDGFKLSVDYFDIDIGNAITAPGVEDITASCAQGVVEACDRITRDETGTIVTAFATTQNIARFKTRGLDIEAAYSLQMSRISKLPGRLNIRLLATYVDLLSFETEFSRRQVAGDVGGAVLDGVPRWRATANVGYDSDHLSTFARIRYVGGGKFDHSQPIVNNKVSARTYVDVGVQFNVADHFSVFGNVNNLFDVAPPLMTESYSPHYDIIGTYMTAGVRLTF